MVGQVEIVRRTISEFCLEFIEEPYLCYTEHGLHALFFTKLFNAFPEDDRYVRWLGNQVCVVQKEYPTAEKLGKPRRQHWDISVIKKPPESQYSALPQSYDRLKLAAVVEFGMNERKDHLIDDIERVCHHDANLENGFVVHLYRLSKPGARYSNRDGSPKSNHLLSRDDIRGAVSDKPVEVYYGVYDSTGEHPSGLWLIKQGEIIPVGK